MVVSQLHQMCNLQPYLHQLIKNQYPYTLLDIIILRSIKPASKFDIASFPTDAETEAITYAPKTFTALNSDYTVFINYVNSVTRSVTVATSASTGPYKNLIPS